MSASISHADVPALSPVADPGLNLASLEIPHPRPFVCSIQIQPSHLSRAIAHVNNIEYVRWLDRAAELHADSLGYTRAAMLEQGIMWFVARHEIDYLAEAWPGDELFIATWVRDMGKVKSWRDYAIVRQPASCDPPMVCRAATLWVLMDLQSRRPKRIEREMAARFQPLNWQRGDLAENPADSQG